jgi:hypothetical protein
MLVFFLFNKKSLQWGPPLLYFPLKKRAISHISTVDCHCHAYLVAGVVHNNVVSVIMDDVDKKTNSCHYFCQSSYISYKGD